jgi:hypothetical protein
VTTAATPSNRAAVWTEWCALADDNPAPVKTIARSLGMRPADVAAIVYPAATYGEWADDWEPNLAITEGKTQ